MALPPPGLIFSDWVPYYRRDQPMKDEATGEMFLQATVALLAMGLAVFSLLLMGRWV
jgi:hypothetical protein